MEQRRLGVGVIGLGPAWRRYRRALRASRDLFAVVGVADAVQRRAVEAALRLGCVAAEGVTDLLQTPGLDALLLLETSWHGLWPLEQACRLDKPVFCVPSLACDPEHATRIAETLSAGNAPVYFEHRLSCSPSAIRLRRVLRTRLGPPRWIVGQLADPAPACADAALADCVDWCNHLMAAAPQRVSSTSVGDPRAGRFESLLLDFGTARCAQLSRFAGDSTAIGHPETLRVLAEEGWAEMRGPRSLYWRHRRTTCREDLRGGPMLEERLLRRFHRDVMRGEWDRSELDRALLSWRVLEAAARSQAEGRIVEMAGHIPSAGINSAAR